MLAGQREYLQHYSYQYLRRLYWWWFTRVVPSSSEVEYRPPPPPNQLFRSVVYPLFACLRLEITHLFCALQ